MPLRFPYILVLLWLTYGSMHVSSQEVYVITPLKINSKQADFSPMIHEGSLYFCSRRKAKGSKKETLTDGYKARIGNKGVPEDPELMNGVFFSSFHDGPFSITKDGKTIVFSRNYETEVLTAKGTRELPVGIFFSTQRNGTWSDPVAFEHNDPAYSVAHPSISPDGKTLYFSSNMPGGYGGSDIYVSRMLNGKWSDPENLGTSVNSAGQDVFPYLHSNGRLYFSSDGREGFGGLDICYSFPVDSGWHEARMLDSPINSKGDDFGFAATDAHESGYFASSRDGRDMLYQFEISGLIAANAACDTLSDDDLCATFFEQGPATDDQTPFIGHEWDMGDGTILKGTEVRHCFAERKPYTVRLLVSDTLIGQTKREEASFTFTPGKERRYAIICTKQPKRAHFQVMDNMQAQGSEVKEFIWKFDGGEVLIGERIEVPLEVAKPGTSLTLYIKSKAFTNGKESIYCVTQLLK